MALKNKRPQKSGFPFLKKFSKKEKRQPMMQAHHRQAQIMV